jgi:hypothetical protein
LLLKLYRTVGIKIFERPRQPFLIGGYRVKAAIVVLSDPKSNCEETLGRVFNALTSAYEFKRNGDDVTIFFQDNGSGWTDELTKSEHPAHGIFEAVKDKVAAVTLGRATVETSARVAKHEFRLIKDGGVLEKPGPPTLQSLLVQGYAILTF